MSALSDLQAAHRALVREQQTIPARLTTAAAAGDAEAMHALRLREAELPTAIFATKVKVAKLEINDLHTRIADATAEGNDCTAELTTLQRAGREAQAAADEAARAFQMAYGEAQARRMQVENLREELNRKHQELNALVASVTAAPPTSAAFGPVGEGRPHQVTVSRTGFAHR